MKYVVDYELCALVFLIVVTVRFFSMRKFSDRPNKVFGLILYCAIINIISDIIGAYFIENASSVPVWLNYLDNTIYYSLQVGLPAIMLFYVIVLSGREIPKHVYLLLVPVSAAEIFLLASPMTHLIFSVDSTPMGREFVRGAAFNLLYYVSALYMALTIIAAILLRRSLLKNQIRTIIVFVLILFAAVGLQILFPNVLLTGVAMSLAIFMMFLTMQNPETMLDSITGTFNYSALTDYLRRQISDGREIWIAAVDVGGIRRVNSMLGIRTGNELLEKVGQYINSICARRATAFRMIGTRFIIVSSNETENRSIVNSVFERFAEPWTYGNTGVMLLATIRYCENKTQFASSEDVINLVDIAYSKVAEEGFGTVKSIEADQLEHLRRKGQIKAALERGISSGKGFYLNFQPLYSVKDKQYCGAEALLRFKDSELGQISPAEFIPIAESTDLIYRIDRMVIRMACDFLKAHPELFNAGLKIMEVNLSATEFNTDTEDLYDDICRNIKSIEDKICFEVTETAVTSRRDVLADFMHRLIERGVRFAIDDFGTGYANITQLAKLPFSVVKLDRIFVSQNSGKEAQILRDLVNMFDHLDLSTVFEGVETVEQADFASELGVDQIQGFYYSHPLTGEGLIKLMTSAENTATV